MIRVALVEDDAAYREELIRYLRRYEGESGERFRISAFADGDEIVDNYSADYDIILMDIVMTYMDGMKAAEQIRKVDGEVVIIFITNTPQYVMKGYMVDALDYVLKPVTYFAFSQKIDRALARMRKRAKQYIPVFFRGGVKKLDVSSITYVEVRDHDLIYHTTTESLLSKGTLTEVEELLGQRHFFRCNKCCLVNLEYPMDLSALFGNALDNAIESAGKLVDPDKRLIHVSVSRLRQFLRIRVENCYEGELQYDENGIPATTKTDKNEHGFGLKSMQATVAKYNGSLTIHARDGWFELRILFPL